MDKKHKLKYTILGLAIFLFSIIGCNAPSDKKTEIEPAVMEEPMIVLADLVSIKDGIQVLESAWAKADNARDVKTILSFYSDDAISMSNNGPMTIGKAAIQEEIEKDIAKKAKGETVSYNTLEVFGNENIVTEIGTAIAKDASGKVIRTGKYMAIWEKRDGKYICIRDIYNNDAKVK
ncbi:MAG TPA: nuclear transport factor 2 family protein [Lutibacter sp.]